MIPGASGSGSTSGGTSSTAGVATTAGVNSSAGSGPPPTGGSSSTAGTSATGGASAGTGATTGGSAGTAGSDAGMSGSGGGGPVTKGRFKMLVYHETRAYEHPSIKDGVEMLTAMAMENDFEIAVSDGDETVVQNDVQITAEALAPFDMIFFMNPTGDIFGAQGSPERDVFKNFLKEKKSFAGVHAATDTEYSFPWYEDLVGEIYDGHAKEYPVPSGTINIEPAQKDHPAMAGIPSPWTRNEEWYIFQHRISNNLPGVNILMRYGGGASATGPNTGQPLAWTRCWEGVRSFYTALGHEGSSYKEPLVRKHILGGILWAARRLHAPGETCP
jgi:type 1 glutamine amidotransferase